ncbi:hypothetical protein G3I59_02660 [Amycolatopsis rubida]|uniref:Uncharacterized protein n=1 Tax=Amycolatopsis rubida TaxID=112413 RepID=A0ABX0BNW5_9PSEU|nr:MULTISPECIES: hypothetical protein [Amycolatopsis]MYW89559.1 hypothetical protein [Amycolatopsis rubida]NEC54536.1 hypothetical protein [Amycolatopsis rubida]
MPGERVQPGSRYFARQPVIRPSAAIAATNRSYPCCASTRRQAWLADAIVPLPACRNRRRSLPWSWVRSPRGMFAHSHWIAAARSSPSR